MLRLPEIATGIARPWTGDAGVRSIAGKVQRKEYRMLAASGHSKSLATKKMRLKDMSKNILKIIEVMLVMALALTFSVGAVSAAAVPLYDGSVTIVSGSLAQTTVPVDYTNPGQYVYAGTDAGVLNAAYDAGSFTYNLTNTNGVWQIADINGITAANGKNWYVYVNDAAKKNSLNPSVSLASGSTVGFVYASDKESSLAEAIMTGDSYIRVYVVFTNVPTIIYDGSVSSSSGTFNTTINDWSGTPVSFTNVPDNSGLGVLMRGSAGKSNFDYSLGAGSYEDVPYTWLNSINNFYPDWSATGYGYTIFKELTNGTLIATDSLEKFTLSAGEALLIMNAASSSGGIVPAGYAGTTVTDDYGTVYYPNTATHSLRLALT